MEGGHESWNLLLMLTKLMFNSDEKVGAWTPIKLEANSELTLWKDGYYFQIPE